VLVWGLLYVPWFVTKAYRKDNISIVEVLISRRQLAEKPREDR
jgi:hypothetical protein